MAKIPEEARIITQTFSNMGVRAKAVNRWSTPAFFLYGIEKGNTETISRVLKTRDEMSLQITRHRRTPTIVRFHDLPIMLEVPHAAPETLYYQPFEIEPRQILLGTGFEWGKRSIQFIDLDDCPHTLLAAQTGGGKSVLMRGMILSMADNTPPDLAQFILIDMKHRALVPFQRLPHAATFASEEEDAIAALRFALEELNRRKTMATMPYTLVIWIDELAQLPKAGHEALNRILALGRELQIHVISATQHPIAEVLGGALGKVNYTARLVGRVDTKTTASNAAGRSDTGAEYLPSGQGAFLRVEGPLITRFQSHMIGDEEIERQIDLIARRWGNGAPAGVALPQEPQEALYGVFEEYHDGTGDLRRGGMMAAIRAMYGPAAKSGGRIHQEQRESVLELFDAWLQSLPAVPSGSLPEAFQGHKNGLPVSVLNLPK